MFTTTVVTIFRREHISLLLSTLKSTRPNLFHTIYKLYRIFNKRAPVRSYLGVTIKKMCRRHYSAPGDHYPILYFSFLKLAENYGFEAKLLKSPRRTDGRTDIRTPRPLPDPPPSWGEVGEELGGPYVRPSVRLGLKCTKNSAELI